MPVAGRGFHARQRVCSERERKKDVLLTKHERQGRHVATRVTPRAACATQPASQAHTCTTASLDSFSLRLSLLSEHPVSSLAWSFESLRSSLRVRGEAPASPVGLSASGEEVNSWKSCHAFVSLLPPPFGSPFSSRVREKTRNTSAEDRGRKGRRRISRCHQEGETKEGDLACDDDDGDKGGQIDDRTGQSDRERRQGRGRRGFTIAPKDRLLFASRRR